jgi:hypothetical protein
MSAHAILAVLMTAFGWTLTAAETLPSMPMAETYQDSIRFRWENKAVQSSRMLDTMEDATHWEHSGAGAIELTEQRAKEGRRALRLTCPTKGTKRGGEGGRPWGAAIATRKFEGENWQDYNRLSFWVYPDLPGFKVVSLCVVLRNDGAEKVPNMWDRNGRDFVLVHNQRWNHVVMEIAHLGRDKVMGVEFSYRQQGRTAKGGARSLRGLERRPRPDRLLPHGLPIGILQTRFRRRTGGEGVHTAPGSGRRGGAAQGG